jgi:predicted enzyme related to lactoylglutathione lyase
MIFGPHRRAAVICLGCVHASRFSRYLLRTTDVEAAAAFYDAVLGRRGDGIVLLHESAIARGARPHWLGHIGVRELGGAEAMAARFVERGAMRLGPPADAADFVVLRDPGGAIVAVADGVAESSAGVAWHQLNTREPTIAAGNYSALFGWSFTEELDLGRLGRHRQFAFGSGEASVGLISDVEGRPEVHTHWLFFFAVPALDVAVQRVRAHGGLVVGPIELPNGVRVAACDDAQGAAFGVIELDDAPRDVNGQ